MTKEKIKFMALVGILLTLLIIGLTVERSALLDMERLRLFAENHPIASPLVFASLVVLAHLLFIPLIPTSALAGYIYGTSAGMAVAFMALMLSCTTSFLLARNLGRPFVERAVSDNNRIIRLSRRITSGHGLLAVMFFRLVPVMNFLSVNALFGISRIRMVTYLVGSAIGLLPGVFLLTRVGTLIEDWTNPELYIYIGAYIALTLTTLWVSHGFKNRFS